MRFRRLCLEIFAFRRFFSEPIEIDRFPGAQCKHRNRCGATVLSFRRDLAQGFADEADVLLRLYLPKNRENPAGRVDYEGAPLRAHVFLAIHTFLNPDAVPVHDLLFGIGENRERLIIFIDKLSVALRRIDTHAKDFRFVAHAAPRITQAARLHRATRCVVFWIKIKNNRPAAKIAKRYVLALAIFAADRDRFECRGRGSHFQLLTVFHVSKTMISIPTAQSKVPMRTLSYFSSIPSFSLLSPASVSEVNKTIPATVATERTAVSTAKPPHP